MADIDGGWYLWDIRTDRLVTEEGFAPVLYPDKPAARAVMDRGRMTLMTEYEVESWFKARDGR